jgi:hypothetical protein
MKKAFIIMCICIFTIISSGYTQTTETWKCQSWAKTEVETVKPIQKPVIKPSKIQQKQKTIKKSIAEKCEVKFSKEKKNMFFIQPLMFMAYSNTYKHIVLLPGVGVGYMREITPSFTFGFSWMYSHAIYEKSFNINGGSFIFGYKF